VPDTTASGLPAGKAGLRPPEFTHLGGFDETNGASAPLATNVGQVSAEFERERPEDLDRSLRRDFQLDIYDRLCGRNRHIEGRPYLGREAVRQNRRRKVELVSGNEHNRHEPCASALTDRVVQTVSLQDNCKTQAWIVCESGEFVWIIGIDAKSASDEPLFFDNATKDEKDKGWGALPGKSATLEDGSPGVRIRAKRSVVGHEGGTRDLWSHHHVGWEVEGHAAFNSQR